jgi:glucose/arabinose dehydrogenase
MPKGQDVVESRGARRRDRARSPVQLADDHRVQVSEWRSLGLAPLDVLTGFVKDSGEAMGRPVGVAVDSRGGLLVADDVGNVVWRVAGPTW